MDKKALLQTAISLAESVATRDLKTEITGVRTEDGVQFCNGGGRVVFAITNYGVFGRIGGAYKQPHKTTIAALEHVEAILNM